MALNLYLFRPRMPCSGASTENAEALHRLQPCLDALGVGMVYSDGERILHANDAMARGTGYTTDELAHMKDPFMLLRDEERELFRARMSRRLDGDPVSSLFETIILHRDGHEIPVEISVQLVPRENGRPGVVAAVLFQPVPTGITTESVRVIAREFIQGPPERLQEAGRRLAATVHGRALPDYFRVFAQMGLGSLAERIEGRPSLRRFVGRDLLETESNPAMSCEFTLGYLSAAVEQVDGGPALGAEVRCVRRGAPACEFMVRGSHHS